jgi:hypothetical protein
MTHPTKPQRINPPEMNSQAIEVKGSDKPSCKGSSL